MNHLQKNSIYAVYLKTFIYSYLKLFIDIYLLIFIYNYLLKITYLFAIIYSQLSTNSFFIGINIYLQITTTSHVTLYQT